MTMVKSRRAINGEGDSHYNAPEKKWRILGDSLSADNLPAPNRIQLLTSVLPEDKRYKRAPFKKFLFWLVARPWFWVSVILMGYAIYRGN